LSFAVLTSIATSSGVVGNAPDLTSNGLSSRAPGLSGSKPTANGGAFWALSTLPFLSVIFASPLISADAY
jgi:hypothetical protein